MLSLGIAKLCARVCQLPRPLTACRWRTAGAVLCNAVAQLSGGGRAVQAGGAGADPGQGADHVGPLDAHGGRAAEDAQHAAAARRHAPLRHVAPVRNLPLPHGAAGTLPPSLLREPRVPCLAQMVRMVLRGCCWDACMELYGNVAAARGYAALRHAAPGRDLPLAHGAVGALGACSPPWDVGLIIELPVKPTNRTCSGLCTAANKIVQRL